VANLEVLKDYFNLAIAHYKGQMSYRGSFLIENLAFFLVNIIDLLAIFILFDWFPDIKGWTLWEIVLLYGTANISLAIAEMFGDVLERVPQFIREGDFDRYLIRPISPLIQLLPQSLRLHRFGRLLQGLMAIGMALAYLDTTFGFTEWSLFLISILSSSMIYFALFLLNGAVSFWTVDSAEAFNAFTYGGTEFCKFPLSIYQTWMRHLFVFIIPLGITSYAPITQILGKYDPIEIPLWVAWVSPLYGVLFIFIAYGLWRHGINHYQSTGS